MSHRRKVRYFADVDPDKINRGFYVNRDLGLNIPIVHVSSLCPNRASQEQLLKRLVSEDQSSSGIRKGTTNPDAKHTLSPLKKQAKSKTEFTTDPSHIKLIDLPIIVCVAMYRSGGALERNVRDVAREEGETLWHLS